MREFVAVESETRSSCFGVELEVSLLFPALGFSIDFCGARSADWFTLWEKDCGPCHSLGGITRQFSLYPIPFPVSIQISIPFGMDRLGFEKSVPKAQSVSWMKLSCRPVFPLLALWEKKILELQQVQAFIRTTFPSGTPA